MQKITHSPTRNLLHSIFAICWIFIIVSCDTVSDPKPPTVVSIPDTNIEDTTTSNNKTSEDFKVLLKVTENMNLNESGILEVVIGAEDIRIEHDDEMVKDSTTIPAKIGHFAKIKPFAPDFEISPLQVPCIKIDSSGSHIRFEIVPKKKGILKVSADIQIYRDSICAGTFVPKTAATLSVNVTVNTEREIENKLVQMLNIVWDNFIKFWGALVALLFGTLFYFIRKKLKNKTGNLES